jgi:hypothetical protein
LVVAGLAGNFLVPHHVDQMVFIRDGLFARNAAHVVMANERGKAFRFTTRVLVFLFGFAD